MRRSIVFLILVHSLSASAFVDVGQINAEISRADPSIVGWASGVAAAQRGPQDYAVGPLPLASYGSESDVLGSTGSPCSLGDGGWITLTFDSAIVDGPGADFAVFENAFEWEGSVFLEIGFVEVSSNGVDFARMPSICRHGSPMGAYDGALAGEFYNLAGNFVGGTGFDLADLALAGDPLVAAGIVQLNAITHVRIVDVIGDGSTLDALGQPVFDPYPTAFASGGMDLTGVAVLHSASVVHSESASFGRLKSLYGRR